jgi:translation initiation factor 6
MGVTKCIINGSDYVGVFATATDRHLFLGARVPERSRQIITSALCVVPVELSIFASDLVGLFIKANSNGVLLSNIMEESELKRLKEYNLDLRMEVMHSNLNAIGNNIIANDKIAVINPDYDAAAKKQVEDVLGVEVIEHDIGGFKTVGANNILTNKGFVISNNSTDQQKEKVDKFVGFDSIRTTANTGALSIGLSTISNSKGLVVGDSTTGFELTRITDALEIND